MSKKLVQSDLGIPLTEEQARQVDSLVKQSNGKAQYHKAQFNPSELELIEGERADISTITTSTLDKP